MELQIKRMNSDNTLADPIWVEAKQLTKHFAADQRGPRHWEITHIPSGYSMCEADTLDHASQAAKAFEQLPIDWDAPTKTLQSPANRRTLRAPYSQLDGIRYEPRGVKA